MFCKKIVALTCLVSALAWQTPLFAAQTVYIWTDESGAQHITDSPPPAKAQVQRKLEGEPDAPAMSDVNRKVLENFDTRMQELQQKQNPPKETGANPGNAAGSQSASPAGAGAVQAGQPEAEGVSLQGSFLDNYYEQQRLQEAKARAAAEAKARGDMKANLNIRMGDAQQALDDAQSYERRARRNGDSRAAVRARNQQDVVKTRITVLQEQMRQLEKDASPAPSPGK